MPAVNAGATAPESPAIRDNGPVSWWCPKGIDVGGVVDAKDTHLVSSNIQLIDGTGALCDAPVSGERLAQQLQQQRPVNAPRRR